MTPLEHEPQPFAALHLPPSSPRQGIIRLVQHGKEDKGGNYGKVKAAVPGKIELALEQNRQTSSSPHARSDRSRGLRNEQDEAVMKREHSSGRSGRDGTVSVISRLDPSADFAEDRSAPRGHHHHSHHHQQLHSLAHHHWQGHDSARGSLHGSHGHRGGGGWGAGQTRERETDLNSRLDVDSQSSSTRPGQTSSSGKLFDPRKDDPVRFASLKTKYGMTPTYLPGSSARGTASAGTFSASSSSDIRSLASTEHSTNTSSEGRERRRRRGPSSRTTNDSGERKKGGAESDNNNSYVLELKRWYREIASLEHKLQEEHRSASERQRKDQADNSNCPRSSSSRQGFTASGELDHPYWVNLVGQHRQLAETHAAFMEAALKPGLPASLHSLPQSYNIPTRLWHTAFHSLLERLRHTLPSSPTQVSDSVESQESTAFQQQRTEVLDMLTEFIYYAYSFYSNLLESETFKTFRSSWIENLGDLARYRMAIAKITAKQDARSKDEEDRQSTDNSVRAQDTLTGKDDNSQDRASIGSGALQDWDLEEKEVWRLTAKDWYAKGLSEMPGIGRLHHHLGILSRDDELRALHHFCKSLTSSHPYLSARESILPLFERESQLQRVQPDASLVALFVHLHGILFTRVQLDDFEDVFSRFQERLQVVTACMGEGDEASGTAVTLSSWMMMATVNIASLLQYGADGVEQPSTAKVPAANTLEGDDVAATKPTAILDSEQTDDGDDDGDEQEAGTEAETGADTESSRTTVTQQVRPSSTGEGEGSVTVRCAARLTFAILSALISPAIKTEGTKRINPYVTMVLTFLSQECKQTTQLETMERFVPWQLLLELGNHIPSPLEPIDPRHDIPLRIRGDSNPLSEDWCLRGMAWVGRRVYERGFWKASRKEGGSGPTFESEIEVLNQCSNCYCGQDAPGSGESGEDEEPSSEAGLTLSKLRWKRVAYTLTILIKTVPGLDYEPNGKGKPGGLLVLTSPLKDKISAWEAQSEKEAQAVRSLQLGLARGSKDELEAAQGYEASDDDDVDSGDDALGDEEGDIGMLKQRRRQLRKQLRESKLSLNSGPHQQDSLAKQSHAEVVQDQATVRTAPKTPQVRSQANAHILPGYTILLLDTNVMLTPVSVLEQLVESEKWTSVVPLAAVTELEGLKKRSGPIGQRADRAIEYLSSNVKAKTKYLKVQTSRGNYLSDLRFRTEEIDFCAIGAGTGGKEEDEDDQHHRMARSIDEVILRCLEWQREHFMDRLPILANTKDELEAKQSQISKLTVKAALITLDKNLRLKARFRGLVAIGPNELVNLLEPV